MDTGIQWNPPTLKQALELGETIDLPKRQVAPDKFKYQCSCAGWAFDFAIIDTRSLPHIAQDWTCDGCWTYWLRNLIKIDTANSDKSNRDWLQSWCTQHNAPQIVIENVGI